MMTPEEVKEYNRCLYLEFIEIEIDIYTVEDYLNKAIEKGYFTDEDIEIVQGYLTAAKKVEELAMANRRFDYDE